MDLNLLAPWLHAPMRRALDGLASGRLAHALLVCGPKHIGKTAFADALAKTMLCRDRRDGFACGRCRDCQLFETRAPVDPREVRPDGSPAHPGGRRGHPDFRHVTYEINPKSSPPKMFGVLSIEQIRDLGAWLALTPQRGGAQVVVIDPANAMNENASNALLKTLEEPLQGRHLMLLSDAPMRLSATIRSRCQRIDLQPPADAAAWEWLRTRGIDAAIARTALDAAHGHPGLAAHWIDEGLLALREAVGADLARIADGSARPLDVASAWLADERAEQRLGFAADVAVGLQARAHGAPGAAVPGLRVADASKLSAWFDSANRTRAMLRSPVRMDLALAALLRDWREAVAG